MSMTKETPEFKETFGTVETEGKYAPDPPIKGTMPDIIDDIISYFEENMQVDGLPAHRGEEQPDIETYIGDKIAARDFVIGKIQDFINAEFKRKQGHFGKCEEGEVEIFEDSEPSMDKNDLD